MSYLTWNKQSIDNQDTSAVSNYYNLGYVFGRPKIGLMFQTRSMRIVLDDFELSSENRRVIRKTEALDLSVNLLPFTDYHWLIGKLAKDFYDTKFSEGTFSANKVKELLTIKHNFNCLFSYHLNGNTIGYAICYENEQLLHYSYPFYNLNSDIKNLGMGMMLRAILYAKESGKKYIYLGSAQRTSDTYKLQFKGLEWFDGNLWQTNQADLRDLLQ